MLDFGVYTLITGLVPAFFIAPLGYLSDRMSKRKIIVISGFLSVIGPLWNSFARNWVELIPGTLIGSVVMMSRPARQALIAEDISPNERGIAFSTIFTLTMLPDTFMPTIAGLYLDRTEFVAGMRFLLLINASIRLLVAIIRFKYIKEKETTSNKSTILWTKPKLNVTSMKNVVADMFRPVFQIQTLRVMIVGNATSSFAMGMSNQYQSVFAVNVIGLSKTEWGLITASVGIVRVLTRIPFGRFSDKWGRRRSILINYFIQPPALVAFALARDFNGILFSMIVRILAFSFGTAAWEAMLVDITPQKMRGSLYGTIGMIDQTLASTSAIPGSLIWDSFGPEWVFYLGSITRLFSAGYLYLFMKEPEGKEQ